MLEESGKMIDDSAGRLGNAVQELRELLVSAVALFWVFMALGRELV